MSEKAKKSKDKCPKCGSNNISFEQDCDRSAVKYIDVAYKEGEFEYLGACDDCGIRFKAVYKTVYKFSKYDDN